LINEIYLTVSALEAGVIEEIAYEAMTYHQSVLNLKNADIKGALDNWKEKIKLQLHLTPIDAETNDDISFCQQVKDYDNDFFYENINDILKKIGEDSLFYDEANTLINNQNNNHSPFFQEYFCEQWYQSLLKELKEQRFKNIEKDKLLADLYQRSETLNKLNEIEGHNSEQKNLRLWDMGRAKLSKMNINQLNRVTQFLKKNHQLHEIAKKLGRMANQVDTENITNVEVETIKKVKTPHIQTAGDIVGIHNSNDLERLVSAESMYLTSPELETIFYKRFAGKDLSTYQLQDTEENNIKVTHFEKKSKQAIEDKGPFIIAIDASGSMMGLPEQCAKAFAYGLMQIALSENRDCYVIIFSTQLITYEVTKENGLSEALSFLAYTFNGGTDIAVVLEKSIELMGNEKYSNSDLIVISDFIAPPQSEEMIAKIDNLKKHKNRFHALNLSRYGNPELLSIFDYYWQYMPSRLNQLKQLFKR